MKRSIALNTFLVLGVASVAQPCAASTWFEFREIFPTGSVGGMTFTGSFHGDFADGRITNLSNVSLYRNGVAFRGNGALLTMQYDARTRTWQRGGFLSLNGSANNVMFIDTDYAAGDAGFFNYFYSVTGLGSAAFQPSYYRYSVPETTRMTVSPRPSAAGVPEPSAWALLVLGFGTLGATMRGRGVGRHRARRAS